MNAQLKYQLMFISKKSSSDYALPAQKQGAILFTPNSRQMFYPILLCVVSEIKVIYIYHSIKIPIEMYSSGCVKSVFCCIKLD